MHKSSLALLAFTSLLLVAQGCSKKKGPTAEELGIEPPRTRVEISAARLEDKIRGGLLAELLGNLDGLPHEFKYFGEPGSVEDFTPGLPEGARTDDDTDIEWVYVSEMQKSGELFLAPERITELWKAHVNGGIWCANAYARQLMDLGLDPPLTGMIALNPWSVFNISGQFVCESFGLIAPGMPQTAAMLGTYYTHVTIDGEPSQAAQLFTTMIATAFIEDSLESILEAGLLALDPRSAHFRLVSQVRDWYHQNPGDWRATRKLIMDNYAVYGNHDGRETRDGNGYELNTASTVAALLYGAGDLKETLRRAFNFGWDADCNAATAASIVGVIRGRSWIESQGWKIEDRYRNTSRPGMPEDETISSYGDRLVELAQKIILAQGGEEFYAASTKEKSYRIKLQQPANVEPLPEPLDRLESLREQLVPLFDLWLGGSAEERARAAYLAICLGEAGSLAKDKPAEWEKARAELKKHTELIKLIFDSPAHAGEQIKERAAAAGLKK